MFKKLILLSILFSNLSFAKEDTIKEAIALKAIDDMCGDSWCEGDYNFEFNSLKCFENKNICVLNFKMILDEVVFTQSCILKNKKSHNDILSVNGVKDNIYNELTECIEKIESELHHNLF